MEKNTLKEHRQFRNQLILMTFILFIFGGFLLAPLPFLTEDANEGAATLFAFGFIVGVLALFNIFTYRQNKIDYQNKIKRHEL